MRAQPTPQRESPRRHLEEAAPSPPPLAPGGAERGGGAAPAQARSGGGRAREAAHVRAGGSGRWRRPLVRPLGAMASILDEYEDSLHRSAAVQQSRAAVGIPHSGKRLSAARTDGRTGPGAARQAPGCLRTRGVPERPSAPRRRVVGVCGRRRAYSLTALQHG